MCVGGGGVCEQNQTERRHSIIQDTGGVVGSKRRKKVQIVFNVRLWKSGNQENITPCYKKVMDDMDEA